MSSLEFYASFWSNYFVDPLGYCTLLANDAANNWHSWIPNPFYSLLVLAPTCLSGTPWLGLILASLMGSAQLFLIYKCTQKFLDQKYLQSPRLLLVMILFPLSRVWIQDTIGLGSVSVSLTFMLLALYFHKNRLIVSLFLVLTALTRPSYIIIWASGILACALFQKRLLFWKLLLSSIPSLIAWYVWYMYFYSTYPGSGGFNFLLLTDFQGTLNFVPASPANLPDGFLEHQTLHLLSFSDIVNALFGSIESFNYYFQVYFIKLMGILGYQFTDVFVSRKNFYAAEILGTLYSLLVYLPGFFACALDSLFSRKSTSRSLFGFGLLFTCLSSFLIADPRYILVASPLLVIAFIDLVCSRYEHFKIPDERQ